MKYFIILATLFATCFARPEGSIIPPPPGDKCVLPNGQGLGPAIRELVDLIPADRFLEIYMNAVSNDPEVIRVMDFISGPTFVKIVTTMQNTKEYINILEYFCEDLHFDAYFYVNALSWLLGFPEVTRPPKPELMSISNLRTGFNGMLKDLLDAMPREKIRETYRKRYEQDEYLRKAMEKLGSEEFRKIGDAIEELDEYKLVLQKLRDIGVDVDYLLKVIMDFMGWRPHKPPTKP